MRKILFWTISFSICIILILIAAYFSYIKSPLDIKEDILFEVKQGESGAKIINNLLDAKIIKNKVFFKIMVKIKGRDIHIIPGFYLARKRESVESFWERLIKGEVEKYKLTIPEGYNIYQIAKIIEKEKIGDAKRFLSLVTNRHFIAELGIDAPSLEGYLFPSTYFFTPRTKEEDIIKAMYSKMQDVLYKDLKISDRISKKKLHKILTYASIIQKEAKLPEEMPLISAVFHNRVKKEMKLQCDPTVIYGIKNFNGNLTKKDLFTKHPYNTYTNYGPPPTPIANPSKAAIKAALNPAKVDYLYFVSRNDGTHVFSKTLSEHNKYVNKFQKKTNKEDS